MPPNHAEPSCSPMTAKASAAAKRGLVRWSVLILLYLLANLGAWAGEPLRVYYVRHGEGGHNVVWQWKDKPKEQWPAYVGNQNTFTPKGEEQVAALTQRLENLKLDFIAVSPMWRTRHTILPYLKLKGLKAEIWPALTETPNAGKAVAQDLPPPDAELFKGLRRVKVPQEEEPFFALNDADAMELSAGGGVSPQSAANSLAMAEKTVRMVKERFAGSGKTILLVGHGNAGVTLIRVLTGTRLEGEGLANTGLWMAEEQPDGTFKLMLLNDKPCAGN